jgi:hypothetical protein
MLTRYEGNGKGVDPYPFSCDAILNISQMSGSSSTIIIDLDEDEDKERVN